MDRDPPPLDRRTALGIMVGGVGAILATAAWLTVGFLGNALGRSSIRPWLRVGAAEDLNPQTFERYVLYMERRHAWKRERRPLIVYIKDLYPDDPLALLSTCSHLGCSVKWHRDAGRFRCPCHGGVYDEKGKVVAGPPPRPLTRMEVKIEHETCYVRLPPDAGTVTV